MNLAIIQGRVLEDPRVAPSVVTFTLLVHRPGRNTGADFIPVSVYGKKRPLAQRLHKDQIVTVVGRLRFPGDSLGSTVSAHDIYTIEP